MKPKTKEFDIATDCIVCGKTLGFRGFCSKKCHDEYYNDCKEAEEKSTEDKILIFPDDFVEIKHSEYRILKQEDPKNVEWIYCTSGFKYFKAKPKDKIIKDPLSDLYAEIYDNGWVVLKNQDDKEVYISLGIYPNARFRIIERMLEEVKKNE